MPKDKKEDVLVSESDFIYECEYWCRVSEDIDFFRELSKLARKGMLRLTAKTRLNIDKEYAIERLKTITTKFKDKIKEYGSLWAYLTYEYDYQIEEFEDFAMEVLRRTDRVCDMCNIGHIKSIVDGYERENMK